MNIREFYKTYMFHVFVFFGGLCLFLLADDVVAWYVYGFTLLFYNLLACAVLCVPFMMLAVVFSEEPPVEVTEWILKKIGFKNWQARQLERTLRRCCWKYRIGQTLRSGGYHLLIDGYDDVYASSKNSTKYYFGRIVGPNRTAMRGYRDTYREGWLEPLYKFDTDDKNQLFGFIQNELRANGVLKTKT